MSWGASFFPHKIITCVFKFNNSCTFIRTIKKGLNLHFCDFKNNFEYAFTNLVAHNKDFDKFLAVHLLAE